MCRSIKQLRLRDEVATDEEIEAAALQFVRKISGYRKPTAANAEAFDAAVAKIAGVSRELLAVLAANHPSARSRTSPANRASAASSRPGCASSPATSRAAAVTLSQSSATRRRISVRPRPASLANAAQPLASISASVARLPIFMASFGDSSG